MFGGKSEDSTDLGVVQSTTVRLRGRPLKKHKKLSSWDNGARRRRGGGPGPLAVGHKRWPPSVTRVAMSVRGSVPAPRGRVGVRRRGS